MDAGEGVPVAVWDGEVRCVTLGVSVTLGVWEGVATALEVRDCVTDGVAATLGVCEGVPESVIVWERVPVGERPWLRVPLGVAA